MNIFVFCGSPRSDSSTANAVSKLIETLKDDLPISNVYWVRPNKQEILSCKGCALCFNKGICPQCDDMEEIKKEMINSDVIIFASPVYMHSVSGSTKVFIDRISCWSHYFELRGKIGISLNTSASNGNTYVADYLSKVLSYLGCSVVCNISIMTSGLTPNSLDSIISVNKRKIIQTFLRKEYPITVEQEILFKNCCRLYQHNALTPYEMEYWNCHELNSYNSFQEMFQNSMDEGD